jgi:hypothetical protein
MKPKRTLSAYILLVGIMALSIVGGIVAFQIFTAATKSQISTEESNLTKSLDGTIDQKTVTNLKGRIIFNSAQLNSVSTPVATPTTGPTTTSGGNIVVTPTTNIGSPSATTQ